MGNIKQLIIIKRRGCYFNVLKANKKVIFISVEGIRLDTDASIRYSRVSSKTG